MWPKKAKTAHGKTYIHTRREENSHRPCTQSLRASVGGLISRDDERNVFKCLKAAISGETMGRDVFGLNPIVSSLQTAAIAVDEIGLKRDGVLAILLYPTAKDNEEIRQTFGESVARIIHGLCKIQEPVQKESGD